MSKFIPMIDFKDGHFLIDGKERKVWFVAGSNDLLRDGNHRVMTKSALLELIRMWLDRQ